MKFALAATLLFAGSCAASYPTAYPFENESIVPGGPRPATPTFTFDDSDTGGYIYTYGYVFDVTESSLDDGFCLMKNGFWSHQLATRSAVEGGFFPAFDHNCTAKGDAFVMQGYSFHGTIADVKICEGGECCKEYWDTLAFWSMDAPYIPYYEEFGKVYEDGACGDVFSEEIYCALFAGGQQWGCIEQYITTTERQVVYPCYDSFYNYWSNCKLYEVSAWVWRPSQEPESYLEASTNDELACMNSIYWSADRVCRPYSYYYPDYAKGSGSSDPDSDPDPDSDSDSPAAVVASIFVMLVAFF